MVKDFCAKFSVKVLGQTVEDFDLVTDAQYKVWKATSLVLNNRVHESENCKLWGKMQRFIQGLF